MEKPFVLVADDNQATCTLLVALLHNEFTVETASNGAGAIEKLKSRQYAAILLDLLMPELDGFDVLDFLTRERVDLLRRVIVLTASISPRVMKRMQEYEVCACVTKPFDVEDLLGLVRQCAGEDRGPGGRGPMMSGGMILLLADLLL